MLPLRSQGGITYWSFKSNGSGLCRRGSNPCSIASILRYQHVQCFSQTKHVFFCHCSTGHQLGRILTQFLPYYQEESFHLNFLQPARRNYHSPCCISHAADNPPFQCLHLWTDMDAPFRCTEISISRMSRSSRDLHIKTCGECDTLTNSVLLHQCKIQI